MVTPSEENERYQANNELFHVQTHVNRLPTSALAEIEVVCCSGARLVLVIEHKGKATAYLIQRPGRFALH